MEEKIMKLYEIADSRAGDKGDYSIISVICKDPDDYEYLKDNLGIELVKEKFSEICLSSIKRFEVPNIASFIFELGHALGGGVTRTLNLDPHGKSLCFVMLDIDLPEGKNSK